MLNDEMKKWLQSFTAQADLVALTGDASSRRYWRVGEYILANDPKQESFDDFHNICRYLEKNNIRVPKLISTYENFYLLEDLGDQTFLKEIANSSTETEYIEYKKALDLLLAFQNLKEIPNVVQSRSFDLEKYNFEINMTLDYFASQMLRMTTDEIKPIKEEFIAINKKLESQKFCFVHRDYHSRNLMIKNSELVVIDFQDARMGVGTYDLVSLLEDCYTDLDNSNRKRLIQYYWDHCNKDLYPNMGYEDFLELYELSLLQRVFKAIGSFAYIYKSRDDIRYLKYIGFAMEKIRKTLRNTQYSSQLLETLINKYYES